MSEKQAWCEITGRACGGGGSHVRVVDEPTILAEGIEQAVLQWTMTRPARQVKARPWVSRQTLSSTHTRVHTHTHTFTYTHTTHIHRLQRVIDLETTGDFINIILCNNLPLYFLALSRSSIESLGWKKLFRFGGNNYTTMPSRFIYCYSQA